MSPMPKNWSRRPMMAGVAISLAFNALVIGCLWHGSPGQRAAPPDVVTAVELLAPEQPAAPLPPMPPPRKVVVVPRVIRPPVVQAKAAAAPQAAPADSVPQATGSGLPPSYFGALEGLIQKTLEYPPGSLAKGEEGICRVLVSFSRDGAIHDARLVQDSGHEALDGECRAVFKRIGRFPPVPAETRPGASEFSIELPITYSLDQ